MVPLRKGLLQMAFCFSELVPFVEEGSKTVERRTFIVAVSRTSL